jgi:hypothetical protein
MQPLTGLTLPTEQELQKERQEAAEESAHWYLYVYKVGWLAEGSRSKVYATLATLTEFSLCRFVPVISRIPTTGKFLLFWGGGRHDEKL